MLSTQTLPSIPVAQPASNQTEVLSEESNSTFTEDPNGELFTNEIPAVTTTLATNEVSPEIQLTNSSLANSTLTAENSTLAETTEQSLSSTTVNTTTVSVTEVNNITQQQNTTTEEKIESIFDEKNNTNNEHMVMVGDGGSDISQDIDDDAVVLQKKLSEVAKHLKSFDFA